VRRLKVLSVTPTPSLLVRVVERSDTREDVLAALREIRCSGWVAPAQDGWLPIVLAGAETVRCGTAREW
jgi:hypothetical protein